MKARVELRQDTIALAGEYDALFVELRTITSRWDSRQSTEEERARTKIICDRMELIASAITWDVVHATEARRVRVTRPVGHSQQAVGDLAS